MRGGNNVGRRSRLRAVVAAALIATGILPLAAAPAAAQGGFPVIAPGWSELWPVAEDGATMVSARSGNDITGDGKDDLTALFNPNYFGCYDPRGVCNGTIQVYSGSANGVITTPSSSSAVGASYISYDLSSGASFPQNGTDYNKDGYADALFTESVYTEVYYGTRLNVLYGGPSGLAQAANWSYDITYSPYENSNWNWLAGPDVNGDGASDIVLLKYTYGGDVPPPRDPNGTAGSPSGPSYQFYTVFGGASGLSARPQPGPGLDLATNYSYGTLAGRGDFDGDGFDDVVFDEVVYAGYPSSNTHNLAVLRGTSAGLTNTSVQRLALQISYDTRLLIGPDLDGDGYDDWILALGYRAGFSGEYLDLLVYHGSPSGVSSTPGPRQTLAAEGAQASTIGFGDFDGDGNLDLSLIHQNASANGTGLAAFIDIFFGDHGAYPATRDWNSTIVFPAFSSYYSYGTAVTFDPSGDYDGDGLSDLAVSVSSSYSGPGPLDGAPANNSTYPNVTSTNLVLFYYGSQILRDVSPVFPVGFDRGVGYPTYEFGFDVRQRATNASYYDSLTITMGVGVLGYDTSSGLFWGATNSSLPPGEYVILSSNSTASWDEAIKTWSVSFRFTFNWSFPTKDWVSYRLVPNRVGSPPPTGRGTEGKFRVEKDLAFLGALALQDVGRGRALAPDDWVQGSASLRATGLSVVFEGTTTRTVAPEWYTWRLKDNGGSSWDATGAFLDQVVQADAATDPAENLSVTLVNLPDPGVGAPNASFAFRVDADAPSFAGILPTSDAWIANRTVVIGAIALDPHSGIDLSTLEYQTSTTGQSAFGLWLSPSFDASDPHAVRARATAVFENGEQNYFRWRVKDAVGNGYTESIPFQVRVDTLHVVFSDSGPSPGVWQRSPEVPVQITITDLGASGVNPATVAYRTSTDDVFGYGDWVAVPGLAGGVSVTVKLSQRFAEGDANYVQWRAEDLVGTGLTVSDHYSLKVDATPVVFGNFTPDPGARRTESAITVSINASEGRPPRTHQSGLDPASFQYRFRPAGGNFSAWGSAGLVPVNRDGYNWSFRVELALEGGPGNEVQFHGSDAAGNGPVESAAFAFHLNQAPRASIDLNVTNATLYLHDSVMLRANLSDADGDELSILWQDGQGNVLSDNLTQLDLTPLAVGNYTYVLVVKDPYGATATANVTIQVIERAVIPPPAPTPRPRTAEGDLTLPLVLALIGAGAVGFLVWRRRRPAPPGP